MGLLDQLFSGFGNALGGVLGQLFSGSKRRGGLLSLLFGQKSGAAGRSFSDVIKTTKGSPLPPLDPMRPLPPTSITKPKKKDLCADGSCDIPAPHAPHEIAPGIPNFLR